MDTPSLNQPAFEAVYGELAPAMRRYLGRLVGRESAEDLEQEVFAKVARALPQFRGESALSTWVYRIATNVALDWLRRRASERVARSELEREGIAVRSAAVSEDVARAEMSDCVRQHVDRLPDGHRVVLTLSEDGLTNREIAEVLGITLDTAKIRLHRARRRLREALGTACTFYRDERNELACEPSTPLLPLVARAGAPASSVTETPGTA